MAWHGLFIYPDDGGSRILYIINILPLNFFYVLLTVHLSIFILVINQLDAQNLF